jgi:2-polyprenyl-3-methyl-5-hydroxy-6-metoxy-1,4-benzoquinol methylase
MCALSRHLGSRSIAGLPPSLPAPDLPCGMKRGIELALTGDQSDLVEHVPCALCGGQSFTMCRQSCTDTLHGIPGAFDVVSCDACGLLQTNPRPTRSAIARYYPAEYSAYERTAEVGYSTKRRGLHLAALALRSVSFAPFRLIARPPSRFPAPRGGANRLLDVGTGAGWYATQMVARGWKARGVEPDEAAAVEAARAAGLPSAAITVASAEEANFPDASFDLITLVHVVEHLHNPLAVLRKAHSWLAPGGRLMLWCPNIASLESRIFRGRWAGMDVPRHLYHFTPRTLSAILAAAGFRVSRLAAEEQAFTLATSLLNAVRLRPTPRSRSILVHAVEPLTGLFLAAGDKPTMVAVAHRL